MIWNIKLKSDRVQSLLIGSLFHRFIDLGKKIIFVRIDGGLWQNKFEVISSSRSIRCQVGEAPSTCAQFYKTSVVASYIA